MNTKNFVFLKHHSKIFISILLFSLIIEMISIVIGGFKATQNFKIAMDTLGVFNSQSGVDIEPQNQNISYEEVDQTYYQIAEEEKLDIIVSWEFSKQQLFYVGGQVYRMSKLYTCDTQLNNGYYVSKDNPYLLTFIENLYPDFNSRERDRFIEEYDFKKEPINLTISGELYGTKYSKDIEIIGLVESRYYFVSNLPVLDFYQMLNPDIQEGTMDDQNSTDSILMKYLALKAEYKTGYLDYLNAKYNQYVYTYDDNHNIIVTKTKNISIDSYMSYYMQNENIFAFSLDNTHRYYCLKNIDFFKQNAFSYVGNLKLQKGHVILSVNRGQKEEAQKLVGTKIEVNSHEFEVLGVLYQVQDANVYFPFDDYKQYIAPNYSHQSNVLINDYLQKESIVENLNNNELGFIAKFNISHFKDFTLYIESLKTTQNSILKMKIVFIIVFSLIILMMIFLTAIIVIQSYKLYTTLNTLYIQTLHIKIIAVFIDIFICSLIVFLAQHWMKEISYNTIFIDMNKNLAMFPNVELIRYEYDFGLIFISYIILIVGEFFNGKKVNYFFRKLFQKI